jgi:hypothetical protein
MQELRTLFPCRQSFTVSVGKLQLYFKPGLTGLEPREYIHQVDWRPSTCGEGTEALFVEEMKILPEGDERRNS